MKLNHHSILACFCLLLLSCTGSGSGETDDGALASEDTIRTRTVCLADDAEDMRADLERTVDAWNERSKAPVCTNCQDWDRCLCKALLHELGHALGIKHHPGDGIMHAEAIRSPVQGLHRSDLRALPWNAPDLLIVENDDRCTTRIGWGYPQVEVGQWESAWYETQTRDIWIDPAKRWIY